METIADINQTYATSGGRDFHAQGRFAIASRTERTGKGGPFLVLELRDPTGSIVARCFDGASLERLSSISAIDGRLKIGEFNGGLSAVLNEFTEADLTPDEVLHYAGLDVDVHRARVKLLAGWLAECDGTVYGEVLRQVFAGAGVWDDFCMAAAAVRMHHAEPGGLVRHLAEVGLAGLGLLDSTGEPYDRPYFLAGVFLHDIGKLDTYSVPPTISYSAQGQLAEHQIWSTFRLGKACAAVNIPASVEAKLIHIIEQAHGAYKHAEWQDPVGVEVKALATADFFSSRLGETDREKQSNNLLDAVIEEEPDWDGSNQAAVASPEVMVAAVVAPKAADDAGGLF